MPANESSRARNALLFLALSLALWLPRGLALDRFVTVDEPKWLMRSGGFYAGLARGHFLETFQREHPGVTITWAGMAGYLWRFPGYFKVAPVETPGITQFHRLLRDYQKTPLDILVSGRAFVVLATVVCLALGFAVASRLIGLLPALFAFGLIALDPYLIALTRLLHPDGLLSPLMFLSLLAFAGYLYLGRQKGYLLLSAAAAGLAWLTKSPAFFLAPFIGCMLMVEGWKVGLSPAMSAGDRSSRLKVGRLKVEGLKMHKPAQNPGEQPTHRSAQTHRSAPTVASQIWQTFSPFVIWFGVGAGVFVLLWPAMWVDPLGSLSRVFSLASTYASEGHDTALFFNGTIYDSGKSAWYFYPVAYLWRATPVTLLGLGLAIFSMLVPRRLPLSVQRRRLAVVLLLFAALFGLFISLSEKKFERYLLPVFPALDLVAALGWIGLVDALHGLAGRWLALGLAAIVILVQALGVFQTYPYYLDYYDPLMGGAKGAPEVMMIGWGEGLDQAARMLNTLPDKGRVISWYGDGCFSYFYNGSSASLDQNSSLADLRSTDVVVLYRDQWQRQLPSPEFLAFFQRFNPEYVVQIKGIEYVRIYDLSKAPEGALP